jgi:dolichol-phosphate mannosyltransferase
MSAACRDYELILVDDRSPDDAWSAIRVLQGEYKTIKGVRLSRNYGQHIAITAGLAQVRGSYAVVMDCDLQDPPEMIPELLAKIEKGYDIILARRVKRSHSKFRTVGTQLYFWLLSRVTEEDVDGSYGTFSVLSRKVVDAFLLFGEKERHYLFILRWLGFHTGSVDYEHQERYAGRSSYSFSHLVRHAADGLFFQSTVLLRWIVTLGLLFAVFGLFLAAYFVYSYIFQGSLPGWTSLAVLILLSTGAVLTSLGVIGQYIVRIFDQAKGRPLYLVDVISEKSAS